MDHALVLPACPEILGLAPCSFLWNTNQPCWWSVLLAQHILVMSTLLFAHFMACYNMSKNVDAAASYIIFQLEMTGAWNYYCIILVWGFFTRKTTPQMLRGSSQEFCRDQGGYICTLKSNKKKKMPSTILCCETRQASSKGRNTGFT